MSKNFLQLFLVVGLLLPTKSEAISSIAIVGICAGVSALFTGVIYHSAKATFNVLPDADPKVSEFLHSYLENNGFKNSRKNKFKVQRGASNDIEAAAFPGFIMISEYTQKLIQELLSQEGRFWNVYPPVCRYFFPSGETYRSKLEIAQALDEIRFVMGHESTHLSFGHSVQRLFSYFVFVTASLFTQAKVQEADYYRVFSSSGLNPLAQEAYQKAYGGGIVCLVVALLQIPISKIQEYQADIYSSRDPKILRAGARFFERLHNKNPYPWWFHAIFNTTHPAHQSRAQYLEKRAQYLERRAKRKEERENMKIRNNRRLLTALA